MEWKKFAVGTPSKTPGWTNNDCVPLKTIRHVTHIDNALSILREGVMRPQLVYDKSKLQNRRTLVNWFSPNYWHAGFRYGNVAFNFDWAKLIAGKNSYWVETMDYSPIACRILISEKDYSKDTDFITYDPRSKEGPWWHDPETDTHYWNGNICMEVMVETEISICDCLATQFVQHHPNYCCIAPNECPDRKLYHLDAGGLFIAGVVSRNLPTECLHMTVEESGVQQPTDHLRGALGNLLQGYRNQQATGTITAADASAPALARSVLAAYHRRDTAEESALATLFASADDLQRSVNRLVCAAFGLPVV